MNPDSNLHGMGIFMPSPLRILSTRRSRSYKILCILWWPVSPAPTALPYPTPGAVQRKSARLAGGAPDHTGNSRGGRQEFLCTGHPFPSPLTSQRGKGMDQQGALIAVSKFRAMQSQGPHGHPHRPAAGPYGADGKRWVNASKGEMMGSQGSGSKSAYGVRSPAGSGCSSG